MYKLLASFSGTFSAFGSKRTRLCIVQIQFMTANPYQTGRLGNESNISYGTRSYPEKSQLYLSGWLQVDVHRSFSTDMDMKR